MRGYQAEPAHPRAPLGTMLVVHENRGLNPHIEDVARRLAVAGYRAVAPDFLSPVGGTPADQDAAREAIGKLDPAVAVADSVTTLRLLRTLPNANRLVGAVGFCWGGGMVNRIAVAAGSDLQAGVAFYGPAPDPALAPRVEATMLLHYAGLDERVNATGLPWAAALKAAGKRVDSILYPGVNHAFHNDTSSERYDEAAAKRAWTATLRFLMAPVGGVVE
jgi:carboxymethylenebutenolidase